MNYNAAGSMLKALKEALGLEDTARLIGASVEEMAAWWKGGSRPTPSQLNRIEEAYGYLRETARAAGDAEASQRRQLFDRMKARGRRQSGTPGQLPVQQIADDLAAQLAKSGISNAIREKLPWMDQLQPDDRARLIGQIVLAADSGNSAGIFEAITAWQDATNASSLSALHDSGCGKPHETRGLDEVPLPEAIRLYRRIHEELGGRGPDQADLETLCAELLVAFTPDSAWLWLHGHNPHLRSRPLDALAVAGMEPVLDAIRAHIQGAFE